MRLPLCVLVVLAATLVGGNCTPPADSGPDIGAGVTLSSVNDWAYQLQGDPQLDLAPIAQSAFDLVVIDYSADGGGAGAFSAAQIDAVRNGSGGAKIVLAYLSIGEAEVGRFYFDNTWITPDPATSPDGPFTLTDAAPAFLAPPNQFFPDNFRVRYWDDDWQQIIITNPGGHPILGDAQSYLDRIIDAGFDGVYLDIIDAFEFFGPDAIDGNGERADAASVMIDFVIAIANHARQTRGRTEFLVVPQNGAAIIDADAYPPETLPEGTSPEDFAAQRATDYFAAIDGIGAEDTFYIGAEDNDNPFDPDLFLIDLLDRFRAAGRPVLAIDYVTTTDAIDDFHARARARDWIPYASTRALDRLTINPTQLPD